MSVPQAVLAADLALRWEVPRDCPNREQWRAGLSERVGHDVTLDDSAAIRVWARITLREAGYELDLRTHSSAGSERRTLQARSCGELARASLLMAALLLTPAREPPPSAATPVVTASPARDWFIALGAYVVSDLGSLSTLSFGPGVRLGLGVQRTRVELTGYLLPARDVQVPGAADSSASLRLMAAGAGLCQEFFYGPTLGPCLRLELGRLHGSGAGLADPGAASSTWLLAALGVRGGLHLFGSVFGSAHAWLGTPFIRPTVAVRGLGAVFDVPPLVGRFELSLEARL